MTKKMIFILLLCLLMPVTPTATSAAAEPVTVVDNHICYVIKTGDTLSHIAVMFETSVGSLIRVNNLTSTVIYPQQKLVIPMATAEIMATSRGNISRDDLMLLARAIHAEARGESFEGQVAVGAVILNRLHSSHFPDTIREVIMQRSGNVYQFSPVADGTINLAPNDMAMEAALAALAGHDPTDGALFFYNPYLASDGWIKTLPVVTTIGRHAFANKA